MDIKNNLMDLSRRANRLAEKCLEYGAPVPDSTTDAEACAGAHCRLTTNLTYATYGLMRTAIEYVEHRDIGVDSRLTQDAITTALDAAAVIVDNPVADLGTRGKWWAVYADLARIKTDHQAVLRETDGPGAVDIRLLADVDQLISIKSDVDSAYNAGFFDGGAAFVGYTALAMDITHAVEDLQHAIHSAYTRNREAERKTEAEASWDDEDY